MLPQRSPTQLRSCPAEHTSFPPAPFANIQIGAAPYKACQPATSIPDPAKKERKSRGMNGYCNLESSPPVAAAANGAGKARRSLELTNTKETKAWEGLAIGAVTLARTFSTGSQRFCRSGSQRSRGGLPGALRRAFSMRRPPAGPGMGDGYWRIHDMDGDSDRRDDTLEEHGEEAEAEAEEKEKKDNEQQEAAVKEAADADRRKKKRGGIFKACKKLLRL